jgi:hypothetical protein
MRGINVADSIAEGMGLQESDHCSKKYNEEEKIKFCLNPSAIFFYFFFQAKNLINQVGTPLKAILWVDIHSSNMHHHNILNNQVATAVSCVSLHCINLPRHSFRVFSISA